MSELPRFTIEIEGWEELRVIAPIAEYLHLHNLCRDQVGNTDRLDVLNALDEAAYALWLLLSIVRWNLARLDMESEDHYVTNQGWSYLPSHLAAILARLNELGYPVEEESQL